MSSRLTLLALTILTVSALLIGGCGGTGISSFGSGNIVVFNASAVSPAIPYVDSVPVGSVNYGTSSTITLASGSYDLRFQEVGGSVDLFTSSTAQTVNEGGRHFVYLTPLGRLTWNSSLFPSSTETVIYSVNARNSSVDFYVTSGGSSLTSPVQKFANAAAGSVYLVKVGSGSYRVIATTPGTTTVVADSGSKSIAGGLFANFVLTNGSGTTEFAYATSQ